MLTDTNTNEWKDAVIDKALVLEAYDLLMGTETISSHEKNTAAITNFKSRQTRLAGNISSMLSGAYRALLRDADPKIAPMDAHGIWKFILNELESKTTNTRLFATQEMLALQKGDIGHEDESYSAYGARCVKQGTILKNLLPPGASHTTGSSGSCVFKEGFSTRDLIDEQMINMIIIGLSFDEKDRQLKSMLIHIGVGSLSKILEELRKADMVAKSSALAEATSSSAEALTAKKKQATMSKGTFDCLFHGKNITHDTKDCKVIKSTVDEAKKNRQVKPKKAKKVKDDESHDTESEAESIAQAAKLASSPHRQRTGSCADVTWNADSGATAHMTPH